MIERGWVCNSFHKEMFVVLLNPPIQPSDPSPGRCSTHCPARTRKQKRTRARQKKPPLQNQQGAFGQGAEPCVCP